MLIVTTDELPGYRVRQVLGEVIGVIGRTRNPFQERVRLMDGGGNPKVIQVLKRYRMEAVEQMVEHARSLGANAVLGMRFDTRNVSDMWGDICAYGTAVLVDPLPQESGAPGGLYSGRPAPVPALNPTGEIDDPETASAVD